MKKITSALLSVTILLGMLVIPTGAGAYEFSGNESLFGSDFYERYPDYRGAIYEAMDCIYILPFKGTKGFGATYKDDEIQFMNGFGQLLLPNFNGLGLSQGSAEYKEAISRSGAMDSELRLIYNRRILEQAIDIAFGQGNIDPQNLYDDYAVDYVDDDYVVTWQSARGETTPGNAPYINRAYDLNDDTMYCEWHVENFYDNSVSERIYTILTRNYFNGTPIISYDYLSIVPPSDELLVSYDDGINTSSDIPYYTRESLKWLPDFGKYTGTVLHAENESNDLCIVYNREFMSMYYGGSDAEMNSYIELLKSLGFTYSEQPYEIFRLDKGMLILYKDGNYVTLDGGGHGITINTYPGISPTEAEVGLYNTYTSSNDISVYVSGSKVNADQKSLLIDGNTMIPLRAIFEALGAEVSWDGATQTITAVRGDTTIVLTVGNNIMYVNRATIEINMPPILIGSYTYVPVRAVSEAFNCKVDWNGKTNTVTITEAAATPTPKPTKIPKLTATPKPTATPKAAKAPQRLIILYTDSSVAYKNGEKQYIDTENTSVSPVVIDGRTLVPVRYISEAFDGTVDWNSDTQTVTINVGGNEIKLFIGKSYMLVNGISRELDTAAQIIDGRTMIPLRAFAEAIGEQVEYYNGLIIIGTDALVKEFTSYDMDAYIIDNYKTEEHDAIAALNEYALKNLKTMYDNETKTTYRDVRFMLTDVSNDEIPELIAVGVKDNNMRVFEIYQYEDGNISKISDGSLIYGHGGVHHLTNYNGIVCVGGESSHSANGWMDWLGTYDGDDWVEVYDSHVDIDNNTSEIKGYVVNGEYVSKEEFDHVREEIHDNDLMIDDFTYIPTASTPTPVPIKTPKPTATPRPTKIPKPTATVKPTVTPKITPTTEPRDISILTLYTNSNTAYRNGEKQYIDEDNLNVTPTVIDGRTLVPMRYIAETFGGTVDWNNDTKMATIKVGSDEIKLFVNKNYILINGIAHDLDTPAQIVEGRTMIPLRAFVEAIGKYVDYYNGLIVIGTKKAVTNMMKSDLDKYISDNFAETITPAITESSGGELIELFSYSYGNANEGEFDRYADLNNQTYHLTSTQLVDGGDYDYDKFRISINDTAFDFDAGFHMVNAYAADLNPQDNSVELITVIVSDSETNIVEVFQYTDGRIDQLTCDCDRIMDERTNLTMFAGPNYNGITMNEDGSISFNVKSQSYAMWGLIKTFRLNSDNIISQDRQDYYDVDMQEYVERFRESNAMSYDDIMSAFNISSDYEYEMLLNGYGLCWKDYGILSKGDYFTVVYDDNKGKAYVRTSEGKEGWIDVHNMPSSERDRICRPMFYLAG